MERKAEMREEELTVEDDSCCPQQGRTVMFVDLRRPKNRDCDRRIRQESAATASSCVLLQEPLRPEVFGVFPVGRVVGEPPGVDDDLALGQDVVAAELGVVEIHVGDEERDGHA
ncbi:hypothetical protein KSP40_PGU000956 [Platanthera guangdongensis]|uniref:Uncharacterized protein n=1 Tax=Platanthera guangdongensis TaxID=2320717 RepID=A0ABR2MF32_9ASPA